MTKPRLVVVVPTIRPESHSSFVKAWTPLFEKHEITLVTVWDGDVPMVQVGDQKKKCGFDLGLNIEHVDLFCRRTDACRNLGFVVAASMNATHVLTMDDDVEPSVEYYDRLDPIQSHLDALERRVPLGWMNTAHDTDLYLRGVPYGIRNEAPVMLSHGVWVGTPDFDGETQLRLENDTACMGDRKVPHSLPYYVGPIPRGVLFPYCGMHLAFRAEALPYIYFAPMGPDSGVEGLNRFADIFGGIFWKRKFDELGWATVTGYSTVLHTRASDAKKNFEQEKLGREWMERLGVEPLIPGSGMSRNYDRSSFCNYFDSYADKRSRYETLVKFLLEKK